jgi:chromate transporter
LPQTAFSSALRFWAKLGLISFGGPAGQIAIMQQELVERKGWISQAQFLRALNFCMILPGPEAQQLATYMGWRLHGVLGGIAAGSLFVLPSVFIILFLSWLAAAKLEVPAIAGAFYGIQPVVAAIVVMAVLHIGRKSLKHPALYLFPALALVAVRFLDISFPWVVLAAGLGGILLQRFWPRTSCLEGWDPLN